jgi:hypothetical protein
MSGKLRHRLGRVEALAERRPGAASKQVVFAYPGAPEPPPGYEGFVLRLPFDPTPKAEPAKTALAQGGRLALPPPGTPKGESARESSSPERNRSPRHAVPPERSPAARTQAGAEQQATPAKGGLAPRSHHRHPRSSGPPRTSLGSLPAGAWPSEERRALYEANLEDGAF